MVFEKAINVLEIFMVCKAQRDVFEKKMNDFVCTTNIYLHLPAVTAAATAESAKECEAKKLFNSSAGRKHLGVTASRLQCA